MTDTAVRTDETARSDPPHPLDPATAAEYLAGRDIMAAAGLLAGLVRFAYYGLEEPPKDEVLADTVLAEPAPIAGCGRSWSTRAPVSRPTWWYRSRTAESSARAASTRAGTARCPSWTATSRPWTRSPRPTRSGAPRWPAGATTDVSHHPDLPDHRGRVRTTRRRPAADGPRARLRAGRRARPGLGAPDRRRRRLRGSGGEEGLQGHRRVRAPGAGRNRRLRRRGRARPAPHHAEAHRDHPAGGSELHPGRARAALAGLVDADRLRRPRGADLASDRLARPRRRA